MSSPPALAPPAAPGDNQPMPYQRGLAGSGLTLAHLLTIAFVTTIALPSTAAPPPDAAKKTPYAQTVQQRVDKVLDDLQSDGSPDAAIKSLRDVFEEAT